MSEEHTATAPTLQDCASGALPPIETISADPGPSRVLALHIMGTFLVGSSWAIAYMLPFLARERFGAANWQTTVLTAAVPVTQFSAVYWNHLYARVGTRGYLLVVGVLGCAPVALLGAAQNIWHVMGLFVLAAMGGASGVAAMSPLNADLLRNCYQEIRRGRIFGLLSAFQFLATMLAGQGMGAWLDRDHDAFRVFFPILAGLMVLGLLCFGAITRRPSWRVRARAQITPGAHWWAPLRDMVGTLRGDRRFAGYESAFMSYGVGWMICTALVPVLATDRLHLNYSQFSKATIVAFQLTNISLLAPMGWMVDRVGPMRLARASFLWLAVYPLGLMLADGAVGLGCCAALYAVGMVGVQLTWTLGPVSLAEDSTKAPHYLAIHSTLVGVRGIVAQGIGMAIYTLTGSFVAPLAIAAAGFLWASRRMRKLLREPA